MGNDNEGIEVVLEDDAKNAIAEIVDHLGNKATEEEAVQRAIGTQLYLLQRIVKDKAKVPVQFENGEQSELDLVC